MRQNLQVMHAYLKERPYGLLLFTAIALSLALGLLSIAIDFQDKTAFRVPLAIFVWIIPLLLIFFWLLYLLTGRFLYSVTITWAHVLITVSTTILIVVVLLIVFTPLQTTLHRFSSMDRVELIGNVTRVVFITFVCGQCAYVANVLLGLFTKGK